MISACQDGIAKFDDLTNYLKTIYQNSLFLAFLTTTKNTLKVNFKQKSILI